jgi:hypothetical protein
LANQLLTISYITNDSLDVLDNMCTLSGCFTREYNDEFAVSGAKIGATVNVRRPPRYRGTFGAALNVEDSNETFIPITLRNQFHVDVQFTTQDLLLSIDQFRERFGKPMIEAVANRIDSDGAYFAYQNIPNAVGTPGVPASSFLTYALANAILDAEACSSGTRNCVLDPFTSAFAADGMKGLYNPQMSISENYRRGFMAKEQIGMDWWRDQNIVTFVTGAQGGTPLLTANTGGAFLTTGWAQDGFIQTNGWTASTGVIKVGDIIQIAGVFPANPQSRTQYGSALKQFVVIPPGGYENQPSGAANPGLRFAAATLTSGTFDAATGVYTSGGGAGALSIRIAEAVITGGQFQNATTTAAFTATSAITVNGGTGNASKASPQGLILHKSAIALAFADLPLPGGVDMAARASDKEIGMSIRLVRQYTINNDAEPTRADVLYGFDRVYNQLGVRVNG